MIGRTSAPFERPTTRYARGVAAAVVAVTALVLAANAGPARAAVPQGPAVHTTLQTRTQTSHR
ncbi:hypothetical protein [Streptomyces filipinensis]|uniref:hypothetical protein n=1 Tax=Streptomyces filipinensis TaxID=66887 RepID=UPI001E577622|nr:hypothetical protein [Streptomyces filipinensis]